MVDTNIYADRLELRDSSFDETVTERCRSGGDETEGSEVILVRCCKSLLDQLSGCVISIVYSLAWMVHKGKTDRRYDQRRGHLVSLDISAELCGVELGHDHNRYALGECEHHDLHDT